MITDIKARARQLNVSPAGDGDLDYLRMTRAGQLFTADWKYNLVAAGLMYRVTLGAAADDADVTAIVGGGNGTVPDIEQPEIIVMANTNRLIPIALEMDIWSDTDAPDDYIHSLLFADRTTGVQAVTGTLEYPANQVDGAGDCTATVYSAVTADLTTVPASDEILSSFRKEVTAVVMNGTAANEDDAIISNIQHIWHAQWPDVLASPCSIVYTFAGTLACTGIGSLVFAEVPDSWFE